MTDHLACLLLLLHCTAVTVSQICFQEGAIEFFGGIETDTLIAGRLEICVGGFWRAVYDESWGTAEATLVCSERNFTQQAFCTRSCFGASVLRLGFTDFLTCNTARRLIDCGRITPFGNFPAINAGVICTKPLVSASTPPPPTNSPLCPTSTHNQPDTTTQLKFSTNTDPIQTPLPEHTSTPQVISTSPFSTNERGDQEMEKKSCKVTGIALGGVSAALLLLLVGVVIGWVWSCRRKTFVQRKRKIPEMQRNPSYVTTTLLLSDSEQVEYQEIESPTHSAEEGMHMLVGQQRQNILTD